MTHNLPVRSRDELLFGNKEATEKRKDPEPTAEIQREMDSLDASSDADDYKRVGNVCYTAGMFSAAIRFYSKAIELEPDNSVHYSNRSAAYVNSVLLSGPSLALRDANRCLELNPSWFKAHLRKADALFAQEKLEDALVSYDKVISLNPDCQIAVNSRSECLKRQLMLKAQQEGGEAPEEAPYSEASHGPRKTGDEKPPLREGNAHPTEAQTDELIRTWAKDTDMVESKTATRRYGASVAEADRDAGLAAKEAYMSRFKKKIEAERHTDLNAAVRDSLEKEMLAGSGFDYRNSAQNRQKRYANGTDEVGAAITADCYNSYTYRTNVW